MDTNKEIKKIETDHSSFGGSVKAIASKSHAHRLLIAAALSEAEELFIECSETSADINATAACMSAMGAEITRVDNGFTVKPIPQIHMTNNPDHVSKLTQADSKYYNNALTNGSSDSINDIIRMDAGESGSTLRFLLPVIGVLGLNTEITTHGRLSARPLSPLYEEMQRCGVTLSPQGSNPLTLSGKMSGGVYTIAGNISSQYITGLLFALPLAETDSEIRITGELASRPYVDITLDVLKEAGIIIDEIIPKHDPVMLSNNAFNNIGNSDNSDNEEDHSADDTIKAHHSDNLSTMQPAENISLIFRIRGGQHYSLPAHCIVEGDWSNAAFFLAAGAIAEKPVTVRRLNMNSKQGDKDILRLLKLYGADVTISPSAGDKRSSTIDTAESYTDNRERSSDTDNTSNTISNNDSTFRTGLSDIMITPRPLHGIEIDAENIPDLVPILSLVASVAEGTTTIRNIERLRIKESDRVATVIDTLTRLGADIHEENKCLVISGKPSLTGGTVDSYNDHRIAMTAAIASIRCEKPVIINDPMAVNKSYPGFYTDFDSMLCS